jgi:biopolymer transport protein ExbD
MSHLRKLGSAEVSTSSMADIAFLLLTFFLMTTVINNHKGLILLLPEWNSNVPREKINDRNLFTIHINAENNFLIEGIHSESLQGLREELKEFILNSGKLKMLSDSPEKAVISFKTNRNTSHEAFITALDEIQAAYFEIYASRVGITPKQFRELDLNNKESKMKYDHARQGIPMNISIAEPSDILVTN